ncbi:MAG: 50S ribosomal protein L9 [Bacteroidetes bacterium]|nr:MAG: 50S ribosomal protein L9 [Bacteroidota bacterium]
MQIILKETVKGLGYKNDIVKVKDGYARNFLIPKGAAIMATESNRKVLAENIRQVAHKADKIKRDAEILADSIGDLSLEILTKAGESGKIFGAVTTLQISEVLKAKGFEVDKKIISFKTDVKNLGEYVAVLDFHREVKKEIVFRVVAE